MPGGPQALPHQRAASYTLDENDRRDIGGQIFPSAPSITGNDVIKS